MLSVIYNDLISNTKRSSNNSRILNAKNGKWCCGFCNSFVGHFLNISGCTTNNDKLYLQFPKVNKILLTPTTQEKVEQLI